MTYRLFSGLKFTVLIFIIFHVNVHAAEIHGTFFRNTLTFGNTTLKLTGTGLLRYWGFKVYVGAFYLEQGCSIEEALLDSAKRIEIEYLRPVRGEDFGSATYEVIARNVDLETVNQLRPLIDFHNSLYEDVQPGDRYSLTYISGKSTELALNGEPKGIIAGSDFASAIFSMWLGPDPISES